jgi:hypothetical protein
MKLTRRTAFKLFAAGSVNLWLPKVICGANSINAVNLNVGTLQFAGSPAPAGKIPSDFGGLLAWYKSTSIVGSDGDSVTTWVDSSGNGHNATRDIGTQTYKTNIFGSKPAILFSNGQMDITSPFGLIGAYTFIAVLQLTSATDQMISGCTSPAFQYRYNLSENRLYYYDSSTGVLSSDLFVASSTSFRMTTWRRNDSVLSWLEADTPRGSSACGGAITPLFVGGPYNNLYAYVAEVCIYNEFRSDADMSDLYSYYKTTYGLA